MDDVCYLIAALVIGVYILFKYRDSLGRLMGTATILVVFGDTFHLVPRVLRYFLKVILQWN